MSQDKKRRMGEDMEEKGMHLVWAMVRKKDDENALR